MKNWRTFSFTINGLPVEARFTEENIREIWNPLLLRLEEMQRKKGSRLIVFLAAPPATGKSTLATCITSALCSESPVELQRSAFEVRRSLDVPSKPPHSAECLRCQDAGCSSLASPGISNNCLCRGESHKFEYAVQTSHSAECLRCQDAGAPFRDAKLPDKHNEDGLARSNRDLPAGAPRRDVKIQALGLDGFHYHQDYILSHTVTLEDGRVLPMKQVKGSPETYDVPHFAEKLRALRQGNPLWPVYDRRLHDVVEEQIPVAAPIVLVEGNWLLFQEGGWKAVSQMADYTIFIRAEEPLLRERLIARKMQGGLSRQEAEAFYRTGDGVNIRRVLTGSAPADLTLEMEEDGSFTEV